MSNDLSTPLSGAASFTVRCALLSDVGRVRGGNEDRGAIEPDHGIFIVCDGMGGAAAGEVASRLAVDAFTDHLKSTARTGPEGLLRNAAGAANSRVHTESLRPGLRGMGTTLVALVSFPPAAGAGSGLWLVHVGDSRCYRLRAGELTPLTRDHSFVEEQVMAGQLTAEQAERSPMRNVITRAIGSAPEVCAEIRQLHPQADDMYLLASDGLTRELADAEIAALLIAGADAPLEAVCRSLVIAANSKGGRDNITVLLAGIEA